MISSTVNALKGASVFRKHWIFWKLIGSGSIPSTKSINILYKISPIVLKIFGNVIFPLHLLMSVVFSSETQYDLFKSLAINITVPVISIKTHIISQKMDKIHKIDEILKRLDAHIVNDDEVEVYETKVLPMAQRILYSFNFFMLFALISLELMGIAAGIFQEWRLLYSMYFPFDPYSSALNYIIANLYQFLNLTIIAFDAIYVDSYGPMTLAMLGGHVRLLCMRISKIGAVPEKSLAENNAELVACVQIHKDLIEFHAIIENIITWMMFIQLVAFGINICMILVFMLFYAADIASYLFCISFMLAVGVETFISCYYGTYFEYEYEKLAYSIFSSNWLTQSKEFKQNLRLFAEETLRKKRTMAGYFFNVNIDAFFTACRAAYSMTAVITQIK